MKRRHDGAFSTVKIVCNIYMGFGVLLLLIGALTAASMEASDFKTILVALYLVFAVCYLIFPWLCAGRKSLGKYAMYVIAVLSLLSIPIGTVLGVLLLVNLPKARVRWS